MGRPWELCACVAVSLGLAMPALAVDLARLPAERVVLARESRSGPAEPGVSRLELDAGAYEHLRSRGAAVVEAFPLPGKGGVDLELVSFSPLAPGARFVVVDAQGSREVSAPDVRFFRGSVRGDMDSLVTLTLFEGRIAGFVRAFGDEFGFGPEDYNLARDGARDLKVWSRETAETAPEGPLCAGDTAPDPAGTSQGLDAADELTGVAPQGGLRSLAAVSAPASIDAGTLLRANVAAEATLEWYLRFGSVTAAQNYILNLMAQVSTIYENEVAVQIQVPYVRIFTTTDPYTGTADVSTLLGQLRTEWNVHQTGVQRTVVHLFHHRASGGSGVAYLDVLCSGAQSPSNAYDYGVSSIPGGGATWEKTLVAHELGHNFGSPHTHCYAPEIDRCATQSGCYSGPVTQTVGTIMSYCNQTTPVFGQRVRDVIRPTAEAAYPTCMTVGGEPGAIRAQQGSALRLRKPTQCPTAALAADDGAMNSSYGMSGTYKLAWIKRLVPSCFPYKLSRVDAVFPAASGVAAGRAVRLLVYVDPTASGSPANASLAYTQDVTIQSAGSSFNQFTLAQPVTVTSGHVYVGFYDLVGDSTTNYLAAVDSSHSGDSFRATDSTGPEDFASHTSGSWMLRANGGAVGPGALLEWGAPCNATSVPDQDFAVYRGVMGDFGNYTSLACSTLRDDAYLAADAGGSSFFVVVPQTSTAEGSYGTRSNGTERDPADAACKPQSVASCP